MPFIYTDPSGEDFEVVGLKEAIAKELLRTEPYIFDKPEEKAMPINQKKMAALKKQYGPEAGERIYYAMETKEKKKRKTKRKHKR